MYPWSFVLPRSTTTGQNYKIQSNTFIILNYQSGHHKNQYQNTLILKFYGGQLPLLLML